MIRRPFFIMFLAFIVLLTGCSFGKDKQVFKVYEIINIQNIKSIVVVKGDMIRQNGRTTQKPEEKTIDTKQIPELSSKISTLTFNRLTEEQDKELLNKRFMKMNMLEMRIYGEDSPEIKGLLFIWPDGYIYSADIKSMNSSKRTLGYLTKSKHPEVYKWLIEKVGFE